MLQTNTLGQGKRLKKIYLKGGFTLKRFTLAAILCGLAALSHKLLLCPAVFMRFQKANQNLWDIIEVYGKTQLTCTKTTGRLHPLHSSGSMKVPPRIVPGSVNFVN